MLNGSFAAKDIGEFRFLSLCNPLYWNRLFGILSRVSLGNISSNGSFLFSVSSGDERPCATVSTVFATDE